MKHIFLLSFLLFLSFIAQSQTCHAIFFGDTEDASPEKLGKYIEHALDDFENRVGEISATLEMLLEEHYYTGDDKFTKENLESLITNLNVQPEDMIIFAIACHGVRDKAQTDPYPLLRVCKYSENKYVSLAWIHNALRAKNPKFLLTLGDACNETSPTPVISTQPTAIRTAPAITRDLDKYFDLFATRGDMLICASSKEEPSIYLPDSEIGSVFMGNFQRAMDKAIDFNNSQATLEMWKSLLQNLRNWTFDEGRKYGYKLHPQFEGEINGVAIGNRSIPAPSAAEPKEAQDKRKMAKMLDPSNPNANTSYKQRTTNENRRRVNFIQKKAKEYENR